MIKNFEELKKQLGELADVINSFKSEAVQLRIVELVLHGVGTDQETGGGVDTESSRPAKQRRRRAGKTRRSKSEDDKNDVVSPKRKASAARGGPAQALNELLGEGFFKEKRTIGQIIDHLGSKKARSFKPNELSTTLTRFVRDNRLKRDRNGEGQFEYHVLRRGCARRGACYNSHCSTRTAHEGLLRAPKTEFAATVRLGRVVDREIL